MKLRPLTPSRLPANSAAEIHGAACAAALLLLPLAAAGDEWKLIWQDEFDGTRIDSNKWSPCERGSSDWNDTMTRDPRCYQIGGGTLKLVGIVNPDTAKDPSPYLTGGITSRNKFEFHHGKVDIRARFKSARGAWPALWMLGSRGAWPANGEIDLMEHLNFDDKVHQTIHSRYTLEIDKSGGNPPKGSTAAISRDDWNTYGARWDEDSIIFTVNGKDTLTYPKQADKGPLQWPFDQPFHLILSMQIGGDWVGDPDPAHYPAHLEIDWVRVYRMM